MYGLGDSMGKREAVPEMTVARARELIREGQDEVRRYREKGLCRPPATHDAVNRPAHYIRGGLEAWDVIAAFGLGYLLGNVCKYILRAGHKGPAAEDLRKARAYLDRAIDRAEQGLSL